MRKFFAAFLCVFGLLLCASNAHAVPGGVSTYNFEVPGQTNGSFVSPGSWNVTLTTTDHINWNVLVLADPNKLPGTDYSGVQVNVQFYNSLSSDTFTNQIGLVANSGSGGLSNGTNWAYQTLGRQAQFFSPAANTAEDGSDPALLNGLGGSSFSGNLAIAANNGPARRIRVNIVSFAGTVYQGQVITPEASGWAILLPALIPVGLLLRRRRSQGTTV